MPRVKETNLLLNKKSNSIYNVIMHHDTKLRFQLVIYTVFFVICMIVLPRIFAIPDIQSATRLLEIEKYLRYSGLFFLIWSAIFVLLYLSSFMSLYFSSYPEFLVFWPFFSRKYPKGTAKLSGKLNIDGQTIPFGKITILNETENEIGHIHANGSGEFKIKIRPGKYFFQAEGFGFESKATKPLKLKHKDNVEIELVCFAKEDVFINPRSYHYLIIEKYAFLIPAIAAPILGWFLFEYQFGFIGFLIIVCGICQFVVFAYGKSQKLVIRNRKGLRLKSRELEIADSTGKKKYQAQTDIFGNLIAVFSPGIYKISSRGCLPRNIRVRTRSIADASLKLG